MGAIGVAELNLWRLTRPLVNALRDGSPRAKACLDGGGEGEDFERGSVATDDGYSQDLAVEGIFSNRASDEMVVGERLRVCVTVDVVPPPWQVHYGATRAGPLVYTEDAAEHRT